MNIINKNKIVNKIKKHSKNPMFIFIYSSIFFVVIDLVIFYVNKGDNIIDYLYNDSRDTFMDFFHSIEYVSTNNPYVDFGTLYPPVANLFFRVCYFFIPRSITSIWDKSSILNNRLRKTEYDLRTFQAPMVILIFVFIISIVLLSYIIDNYYCLDNKINKLLLLSIVFSYGFFYAIERGNIIVISTILLLIFVTFYNSENKFLKELAIICLSISANLKLYPAVFGLLLIKEKDYKYVLKTVLYSFVIFVVSMLTFKGGFINNIEILFKTVIGFNNKESAITIISNRLGISVSFINIFKYIFIAIMLIASFFLDDKYIICFNLSLIMPLNSTENGYLLIFLIIPILLLIKKENNICAKDIPPFVIVLLLILPIPITDWFYRIIYEKIVEIFASLYVLLLCILKIVCKGKCR